MTHDQDLTGAVALVTGAAGTLGVGLCAALARNGATVIAADLKPGDGLVALDVTDAGSWAALIAQIGAAHRRLDILVNNAGVAPMQPIGEITLESWRRTMAINVEGVMLGMQAAAELLRAAGPLRRGGASVINIASVAANKAIPFSAAYCASKAAVAMLTKVAAREFSTLGYPIRVNSVHPGAVRSPMIDEIADRFSAVSGLPASHFLQAMIEACPMKRMVEPEDVAGAVVYLASPASGFVHGTEQYVDGGLMAT